MSCYDRFIGLWYPRQETASSKAYYWDVQKQLLEKRAKSELKVWRVEAETSFPHSIHFGIYNTGIILMKRKYKNWKKTKNGLGRVNGREGGQVRVVREFSGKSACEREQRNSTEDGLVRFHSGICFMSLSRRLPGRPGSNLRLTSKDWLPGLSRFLISHLPTIISLRSANSACYLLSYHAYWLGLSNVVGFNKTPKN